MIIPNYLIKKIINIFLTYSHIDTVLFFRNAQLIRSISKHWNENIIKSTGPFGVSIEDYKAINFFLKMKDFIPLEINLKLSRLNIQNSNNEIVSVNFNDSLMKITRDSVIYLNYLLLNESDSNQYQFNNMIHLKKLNLYLKLQLQIGILTNEIEKLNSGEQFQELNIFMGWTSFKNNILSLESLVRIKSLQYLSFQYSNVTYSGIDTLIRKLSLIELLIYDSEIKQEDGENSNADNLNIVLISLSNNTSLTRVKLEFKSEKIGAFNLIECLNTNKTLLYFDGYFYDIKDFTPMDEDVSKFKINNTTLKSINFVIGRDPIQSNNIFEMWESKSSLESIVYSRFKAMHLGALVNNHLSTCTSLDISFKYNSTEIQYLIGLNSKTLRKLSLNNLQPTRNQSLKPIFQSLSFNNYLTHIKIDYNYDTPMVFEELIDFLNSNHPSITSLIIGHVDGWDYKIFSDCLSKQKTLTTLKIFNCPKLKSNVADFVESACEIIANNHTLNTLEYLTFKNESTITDDQRLKLDKAIQLNNNNLLYFKYPQNLHETFFKYSILPVGGLFKNKND